MYFVKGFEFDLEYAKKDQITLANKTGFEISKIKEIVKENTRLEIDNLDDYIVVLDGLDELAMKTGLSTSDIELICQRFSSESTIIIITTRHGYLKFDTFTDKNIAIVELKELDKTRQLSWLEKYKITYPNIKLSSEIIEKFHKNEDKETLFKRTDKALYKAKHNGRNKVEMEYMDIQN